MTETMGVAIGIGLRLCPKGKAEISHPELWLFLSLTEVEKFEGFKNPRESDEFDFNIGSME